MARTIEVLLLSGDAAQAERWRHALSDSRLRVWPEPRELPPDLCIDVLVTDDENLARSPAFRLAGRLNTGGTGVVGIGLEKGADVYLPADFAPRELGLACLLLARAVRLQRRVRRSHRVQRRLRQLAFLDPLTGLPNRRAWDRRLQRPEAGKLAPGTCACLALLDLDEFKSVNDRFGHIAGDDVLRHVGQRLAAARDEQCFVARLGGDEFGLLLTGCTEGDAATLVAWLRGSVCEGSPHTPVTASLGFACADELPDGGWIALFRMADDALRQAKSAGGNGGRSLPKSARSDNP